MRVNMPITSVQHHLKPGEYIVSTTNPKGVITYVNRPFIEISGFAEHELLGKAHNIVRHPDMPPGAFQDLWDTLKEGLPWSGLVKNRCKNGDFYWVHANVAPYFQGGKLAGYVSIRTRPRDAEIAAAERLYRDIREGRAAHVSIRHGKLLASAWQRLRNRFFLGLRGKLLLLVGSVLALLSAASWLALPTLADAGAAWWALWSAALLLPGGVAFSLYRQVTGPVEQTIAHMQRIANGDLDLDIEAPREDELGGMVNAFRVMHIEVGRLLDASRTQLEAASRVKAALDSAGAAVALAGIDGRVTYANAAMQQLLRELEADIRLQQPTFSAATPQGLDMEALSGAAGKGRGQLALGARLIDFTQAPVHTAGGDLLGHYWEWRDRTAESAVEREVEALVAAAAAGEFDRRIGSDGRQGFFLTLTRGLDTLMDSVETGVAEVSRMLRAIAEGDLSQRIEREFGGLLGQMRDDCNRTAERLAEVLGNINSAAESVRVASTEIAAGNADLSMRTEQQAANLEETASSMEELSSTVRQNADNARQAEKLAKGASSVADRGSQVVGQVVETMSGLSAASGQMVEIISTIDGIAFQTNILALNAAVEAARAGEQGRGFAVVASEVRALAQRSAEAAKQVKGLIDDSVSRIGGGAALVDEAGRTMSEILNSVRDLAKLMGEISGATQEQSAGIGQVNETVSQLDTVTQQNAALVEQATAAARSLEEQAGVMAEAVAAFRLRNQR
jgi:methyl-accepting chemotaxis protein